MGSSNDDIGVENLSAAGAIAGETSCAYDEVVTVSMVSARAIGIGAYLLRLGRRVVQVDNSAIILTGASALNKLLGKEVYTSNVQLGGIEIMANNGVSYSTESNDKDGVSMSKCSRHKAFHQMMLILSQTRLLLLAFSN